jgi:formylglycine-generating enzyme required for sulfatase activity
MAGTGTIRVFISYARRDGAALTGRLREDLSKKGVQVWHDIHDIPAGSDWAREIEKALDNVDAVLAIVTPGYGESDHCRAEESRALALKKRLIPLLAGTDSDKTLRLGHKSHINFSDSSKYAERFAKLLAELQGPAPSIDTAELLNRYKQRLLETEFRLVNLLGFPELKDRPLIELPRVFVMPRIFDENLVFRPVLLGEGRLWLKAGEFDRGGNIAFLGKPGSGKTTLLRYIGRSCLETLPDVKSTGGLIPMFFWVRHVERSGAKIQQPDDLWKYFYQYCNDQLDLALPGGFFETQAQEGKLLVLVDGLDEVASSARREMLASVVQRFANSLSRRNRVAITSRPAGYRQELLPDFRHLEILDFGEPEIRKFLGLWYAVREPNPKEAESRAAELWEALKNSGIRDMAGNPLILTLIALIHQVETKLPDGRALLYDKCTECLLDLWRAKLPVAPELAQFTLHNKRRALSRAAYQAQVEAPAEATKDGAAGLLMDEHWLLKQFESFIGTEYPGLERGHIAKVLLDALRMRDGVLTEQQTGRFGFLHKTFQEYFAAWHIVDSVDGVDDALGYIEKHIGNPYWRETLVLAVAQMFGRQPTGVLTKMLEQGRVPFAWECLRSGARVDRWLEGLIGHLFQCFEEFQGEPARLEDYLPLWILQRDKLHRILHAVFEKKNRDGRVLFPALLLLDELVKGEDQYAAHLRREFLSEYPKRNLAPDQDGMVPVAAGSFTMGDTFGDGYPNEGPASEVEVAGFWIDSFPVTNAEYEVMVPGHRRERVPYPGTDGPPVARVSWWEASLYCRWSGARLPTEAEWEKAAAWDAKAKRKLRYPWGDSWDQTKCNSIEGGRSPTPRGFYPDGVSPYGCEDMAGNVWEWTDEVFKEYPYSGSAALPFSRDLRIFRGGAFNVPAKGVRSSRRLSFHPGFRNSDFGFRRARTL